MPCVKRRRALAYSTHACTMDITERIEGRGGVPEWREASVANRVKPELPISSCLDPSNAPSSTRAIVVSLTDAVNHPIKLTNPSLGVVS